MAAPFAPALARLSRWGGGAVLAGSLFFIAERLWRLDWSALQAYPPGQSAVALGAAATLFAAADQALAWGWAALADPEATAPRRDMVRIYGRGVLMKYLPGSVFQYVGRQVGGRGLGLAHGRLARSAASEIGLHLVSSLSVAAACLSWDRAPVATTVAGIVLVAGCLLSRPALLTALACQILAFGAFALAAVAAGAAILPGSASLSHFAALFLLAWLAGFVIPVAPGGLGIREAALIALAGASLPPAAILASALLLRIASISGDLIFGALALARPRQAGLAA